MKPFSRYLLLVSLLMMIQPANAQTVTHITVTDTVVAESPERFGVNMYPSPMVDMNMWMSDGTEPTITRLPGVASDGGADFILSEDEPQTDFWDTLGEGFFDGGRVRVYRVEGDTVRLVRDSGVVAYHATDATGYRIDLSDSGETIQAGDSYIVERIHQDSPNTLAHPRLSYLRDWGTWITTSLTWSEEPEQVTLSRVPDAVIGQTSLKIDSLEVGEAGIGQYNVYPPDEGSNVYDPDATYTMDVWLKQSSVPDGRVRVWFGRYEQQVSQWFDVTDTWAQYTLTFTGLQPLEPDSSVNTVNITFKGGGTVWVDNPRIYNQNAAPYALVPQAKQALMDYKPGTVRIWSGQTNTSLGQTLDSWLAEPGAAQNHYDVNNGFGDSSYFSLPESLTLVQEVGGTPWLIVNPSFSEQEWLNLMEYLSGSIETPYGALRASRGQPTPWTDVFDNIRIELGNETWNGIFLWTYPWDGTYGKYADYFYSVAQSSPSFNADKIDFMVGGFALMTDESGYGQQAIRYAPQSAYMGVTAYIGGWDSVDVSGGDLEAKYRNLLTFTPQIFGTLSGAQARTRDLLAAQGVTYQLSTYEGGPGYALPNPENPFDPETERLGKSLASATTTLEAFLYHSSLGFGPQAFFSFAPGANWTSHTTVSNDYRAHLPWLALQLRNQHCTGAMVATDVTGAPTLDIPAINTDQQFPALDDLPLVASYAFSDESRTCVFVLSRSINQTLPVTLSLPDAPSGSATLYRLTGDPRSNNIEAQTIGIESQSLDSLDGHTFDLPPGSIYLFVQAP